MENASSEMMKEAPINLAFAIIFDTEKKKILIAKRKKQAQVTGLTWSFPGSKIDYRESLEDVLKEKIMEKIGLNIESLGSIFAETYSGNGRRLFSIYHFCEFIDGKEKLSEEFEEIKWVSPEQVENYFEEEIHPDLREFLIGLK